MTHSYNEELKIGDRIAGRYEILGVIGQGSMGVVYKCRHDILQRVVAIKTLRLRERTVDDRSQKRFEREARLASRLDHPNLIGVHDFGYTAGGDPYLVMDFVSGQPLFDIMKRERYLSAERAVNLYSQVCDGLFHAHQRGVIHRDLKPANILVVKHENGAETVKIVDLGVAKIVQGEEDAEAITMTGEVCGSPIYLSPEQCMYQELDPRTDIYSLGVCLYECLMGQPPLRGATVYDTIYMHVHDTPKPFSAIIGGNPEVPKRLEEITLKCLAKQANDRFETMMQLKQELLDSLNHSPKAEPHSPVKVLPPESLYGTGTTGRKTSGEFPRPGKKVAGEDTPRPSKKISGELPLPGAPLDEDSSVAARGNRSAGKRSGAIPASSVQEKSSASGKSIRRKTEERRAASGAESGSVSERNGRRENVAAAGSSGFMENLGLKKMVIFATGIAVIFGLSVGLGFAFFLNANKSSPSPVASGSAVTPVPFSGAVDTNSTSSPHTSGKSIVTSSPDLPFASQVENKSNSSSTVTHKSNTAAANAKTHKTAMVYRNDSPEDLSKLLDEPIGQGSQSKYFSIVKKVPDHHGGMRQMPPQRPMPTLGTGSYQSASAPNTMRSTAALDKLKNNGFIQKMKEFAASQGMPIPGVAPQQNQPGIPFLGGGLPGVPGGAQQAPQQPPSELWRQGGSLLEAPASGGGHSNSGSSAEQAASFSAEGTRLVESKQYGAACQKFEQAYKLDSSNSQIRQMYAWALNARALDLNAERNYGEAVEYCKHAVNLNPSSDLYHKNLSKFSKNLEDQRAGTIP